MGVSAPLAKTDQIVLIGGGNNTTHEVNKLMGTLPPAIQALTGVDLTGALGKIPGATMATVCALYLVYHQQAMTKSHKLGIFEQTFLQRERSIIHCKCSIMSP